MTRLIRIEMCDECPHAVGSRSCRASQWCDEGGILRTRKFTDFPLIPDWCPLEQDEGEVGELARPPTSPSSPTGARWNRMVPTGGPL